MKPKFKINKVDNRGWYICSNRNGTEYLYSDKKERFGVNMGNKRIKAFWDTKKEAQAFLASYYESIVPAIKPLNIAEEQVANTALSILILWKMVIDEGEKNYPNDVNKQQWHQVYMRQAYQDAINAMRANALITDFDVLSLSVVCPSGKVYSKKGIL